MLCNTSLVRRGLCCTKVEEQYCLVLISRTIEGFPLPFRHECLRINRHGEMDSMGLNMSESFKEIQPIKLYTFGPWLFQTPLPAVLASLSNSFFRVSSSERSLFNSFNFAHPFLRT